MKNCCTLWILILVLAVNQAGCKAQSKKSTSPAGYDLQHPEVIKLPKEINQISGLAYYAKDNSVFAIDDDHGELYNIPLVHNPKIEHWAFGKDKDYEDLVLLRDTFYILNSHGSLVYFGAAFPPVSVSKATLDVSGSNEFESLYADAATNKLLMLCKDCESDGKHHVSAYAFDLSSRSFNPQPALILDKKNIETVLGEKISRFKASATNVNPLTGEVFIISSINKLLVIADKNLTVKEAYALDETLFKQPEGLCFNQSGDLFISNEAGAEGKADILIFRRKARQIIHP